MKKRVISFLLALAMVVSLLPGAAFATETAGSREAGLDFAGGTGTKDDPYLIETKEHLDNVRNHLSAYYKMIADIIFTDADFSEGGAFYNSGRGWIPIGGNYPYFTGVLDGNGHTIKNLSINYHSTSTIHAGLFATNKGTICNLGIENCDIFASHDDDVYAYVGGVVGYNYGLISNCYATGQIAVEGTLGSGFAGGIVGWNNAGTIRECYNTASVAATYEAGGIAAVCFGNSIIENCFNAGLIATKKNEDTSSEYTFSNGIAGCGAVSGTINYCYNIGPIVSSTAAGGISALSGDINNCYYLDGIIVDEVGTYDGTTKCSLDHMKQGATFGGFDFNEVWTMSGDEDYLYPELINTPMDFTKEAQGITLSSLPYKTEYYTGLEEFEATGGKIAVVYNDGTYDEVALENSMVGGFDNTQVGKQTLTAQYNNESVCFDIEVLALVYDYRITTDETIILEFSAEKNFKLVLSDEAVAKITNVQSSTIQWGSYIKMTSAATITPIKPGYVVVRAVDDTGNILSKSLLLVEEGQHQMQLSNVIKEKSCTEPGIELHICKFCGHQAEKTIPASHIETTVTGKAATCTETGLTDGKKCTTCGTVTVAQQVIPAKSHTEVTIPGKAATCTTTGLTDGKKCSVCGTTTVAQQIIPAKGHSETTIYGMDATCAEAGLTEAKYCTICETVTVPHQTIPAKGHSYTDGICTTCGASDPHFKPADLIGDADGSGEVDYLDAMIVLQYHTGIVGDDALNLSACDVDGSGEVDYLDAMLLLQYHTGVIPEL